VRLAVFTAEYPARNAADLERDLRGLVETGLTVEVFATRRLNAGLWRYTLDLLGEERLPRNRLHHLGAGKALGPAARTAARRPLTSLAIAARALGTAVRRGPSSLARSSTALPKAWAWAAAFQGRFDHVLAYRCGESAACAYAFHRLLPRPVPFTLWLHDEGELTGGPASLRPLLRYADRILTCCESFRGKLERRHGAAVPHLDTKTQVCHHGLDPHDTPFRPGGRPPRRVVTVGHLGRHRGHDFLLHAVHALYARGTDVSLEVVGDGSELEPLRALAAELGIADRVRFYGWLPPADVRQALLDATVLAHPTLKPGHGVPGAIREAMALGTPVIASRVAGAREALEGGCGVLVPAGDAMALADAIEALLREPARRLTMAGVARHRVETRFNLWRNGARLAELLRYTIRRDRRRGAADDARAVPTASPEGEPC
jgi:glycosyltransferase involved in cell wall biosynthesis